MFYLRLTDNIFGFVNSDINNVLDTDIEITDEDYNKFFELQASGKQFRLKAEQPKNGGLFDYVEEYEPEPIPEKDRYFSVRLKNDVLTKTRHNIVFNAKNEVGGGVRY